MADNLKFELKRGTKGVRMFFTLKGTNPSTGAYGPVAQDGNQVRLYMRRQDTGNVVIDSAACVMDPDQNANPGKGYYEFTEQDAAHPAGLYEIDFESIYPNGNKDRFPTSNPGEKVPFGIVEILDSIIAES